MTDRLAQVFEHKRRSSKHFREVQQGLGMIHTPDVMVADPTTREGTIELHKGIHWINLELSEAISAAPGERFEEMADVLHFLVELCLLAGFSEALVPHDEEHDRLSTLLSASEDDAFVFETFEQNARFTILAALQVAELLKNKPWKQSPKPPPDSGVLMEKLQGVWYWYGATVRTLGMTDQDLFDHFMRKEKINYERIATGV